MLKWILSFSFAIGALFAADLPFLDRLEKAKTGDFIVLEANQTITLLAIRSINSQTLILEEISIPSSALKKRPDSWAAWVKKNAPGHTSWSMMEIDLKDRQVLECYSFSRSAWITLNAHESLLATLLQLPLKPLEAQARRKIGPPPQEGEADRRSIWNPPLVFAGEKLETALFDVFEAIWPQDGTELAGKTVSLYFDQASRSPLPYWIQVETAHATASVRAIDSGKNLPSPFRTLPRRIPEFVGTPQKTKTGLRLSIKSPKYYKDFELFAVDVTTREKQIHPIAHALISGDGEILTIDVDAEELNQVLQPDRKYTWLVVPAGHSESYTESHKPFTWAP
jgi:hypothetical protein